MPDEFDPHEIHYLLHWEKASQLPELHPIEIDDIRETDKGRWVLFHYLDDEELESGAPYCNVLTEKEANRIKGIGAHIWELREEAKRLNREARESFKAIMAELVDEEREIL